MGGICSCGREGRSSNADDADTGTRCPGVGTPPTVEQLVDIVHSVKRVLDVIGDRLDGWDEVVPWRSEMIVWKFNTLCHLELVARACKDRSRRKEGDDYVDNLISMALNSAGDALVELNEIGQSVIAGARPKPYVKDAAFGKRLEGACVKIQDATKMCSVVLNGDGDTAINVQTRHDAAQHEAQINSVTDDGGTERTLHERIKVTPPNVAIITSAEEIDGTLGLPWTEDAPKAQAKTIPVVDVVTEQHSKLVAAALDPDTSNESVDEATDLMAREVLPADIQSTIVADEDAENPSATALESALSVSSDQFEAVDEQNCQEDRAQPVQPEAAEAQCARGSAQCKQRNCAEAVTQKMAFSPSTGVSEKADEQTRKGDLAQAKKQKPAIEHSTPRVVRAENGGSAEAECGMESSRSGFVNQLDCAHEKISKGVAAQSEHVKGGLKLNKQAAHDMTQSNECKKAEAVPRRISAESIKRNDKGDATRSVQQKAISGSGTRYSPGADSNNDKLAPVVVSPVSTKRIDRMAEREAEGAFKKSVHQESAVAVCRRGMVLAAVEKYAGAALKVVPAESVHQTENADIRRRKVDPAPSKGQESQAALHARGAIVATGEMHSPVALKRASSNTFVERIERAQEQTQRSDPAQRQRPESAVALYTRATALAVEGKYAEAAPMLEIAVKKNPHLDGAWYSLCVADRELGKYKDAARDCRRAIELLEKAGETKTTKFGRALNELGLILQAEARYDEADDLYRRALDLFETLRGKNDASTATVLSNIASLLTARGKYAEAIPLSKRALKIEEENLGDNHPQVAMSLNMIAWLLSIQGKYDEAEPLYGRAITILEKTLGKDHPDVAASLNNLAQLLKGKYDKALSLQQRCVEIGNKSLSPDHPDLAIWLNNLARLLNRQGKDDDAKSHYERAISIFEKAHGKDHPSIATSLNNLALLMYGQGKYKEACNIQERCIQIAEKHLSHDHPDLGTWLNNLACLSFALGQGEAALESSERAVKILEGALGADHPDTIAARRVGVEMRTGSPCMHFKFTGAMLELALEIIVGVPKKALGTGSARSKDRIASFLCSTTADLD